MTPQSPAPVAGQRIIDGLKEVAAGEVTTRPASEQPVEAIGAGREEHSIGWVRAEIVGRDDSEQLGVSVWRLRAILAALSPASPARTPMGGEVEAKWAGDSNVLRVGWLVEVLASDPLPAEIINGHQMPRLPGRTACWVRFWPNGRDAPIYRSCDLNDLELSDEAFEALAASSPSPVQGGRQFRHKARGTRYTMLGNGKVQCSESGLLDDENVVIYRGEDGSLWARRYAEFWDGRFEEIAPPSVQPVEVK